MDIESLLNQLNDTCSVLGIKSRFWYSTSETGVISFILGTEDQLNCGEYAGVLQQGNPIAICNTINLILTFLRFEGDLG